MPPLFLRPPARAVLQPSQEGLDGGARDDRPASTIGRVVGYGIDGRRPRRSRPARPRRSRPRLDLLPAVDDRLPVRRQRILAALTVGHRRDGSQP